MSGRCVHWDAGWCYFKDNIAPKNGECPGESKCVVYNELSSGYSEKAKINVAADIQIETIVTLKMNDKTAQWLKNYIKNENSGGESETDGEMREQIWVALDRIGVGL